MANTKSAKKRARQTIRRTARNFEVRSEVKTAVRSARESLANKTEDLGTTLKSAISSLSKAANKGIIHPRNAARRISRLMKAAAPKKAGTVVAAPAVKAKAKAKATAKKAPARSAKK